MADLGLVKGRFKSENQTILATSTTGLDNTVQLTTTKRKPQNLHSLFFS